MLSRMPSSFPPGTLALSGNLSSWVLWPAGLVHTQGHTLVSLQWLGDCQGGLRPRVLVLWESRAAWAPFFVSPVLLRMTEFFVQGETMAAPWTRRANTTLEGKESILPSSLQASSTILPGTVCCRAFHSTALAGVGDGGG